MLICLKPIDDGCKNISLKLALANPQRAGEMVWPITISILNGGFNGVSPGADRKIKDERRSDIVVNEIVQDAPPSILLNVPARNPFHILAAICLVRC